MLRFLCLTKFPTNDEVFISVSAIKSVETYDGDGHAHIRMNGGDELLARETPRQIFKTLSILERFHGISRCLSLADIAEHDADKSDFGG